jgi:hypothetical protein
MYTAAKFLNCESASQCDAWRELTGRVWQNIETNVSIELGSRFKSSKNPKSISGKVVKRFEDPRPWLACTTTPRSEASFKVFATPTSEASMQ